MLEKRFVLGVRRKTDVQQFQKSHCRRRARAASARHGFARAAFVHAQFDVRTVDNLHKSGLDSSASDKTLEKIMEKYIFNYDEIAKQVL